MIPDRDRFVEYASGGDDRPTVVLVDAPLDVDVDPRTAYAILTSGSANPDSGGRAEPDGPSYAFLLESAEKVDAADPDGAFRPTTTGATRDPRFSYVGYDPDAVVTVDGGETTVETLARDGRAVPISSTTSGASVVDALRQAMPDVTVANEGTTRLERLDGGFVGFIAYDAVYDLHLGAVGVDRPAQIVPDAQFVLTTRTIVFDEVAGTTSIAFTPIITEDVDPRDTYDRLAAEVRAVEDRLRSSAPALGGFDRHGMSGDSRAAFERAVSRVKTHVLDGDVYQCVLSRSRELRGEIDPLAFYGALCEVTPSPYMYLLEYDDLAIVGASPETLVAVDGRTVTANPIAGTCPRGSSPVDDRRLAGEMLADDKERAEHTMLVDLARNDVRRVAKAGSVRVEEFMAVRTYSHVQHIESSVVGRLADGYDAFDATKAAFPAGTLSGAPKVRAMEIIDTLESDARGLYGGGVGYYSWGGDADFAIAIRTATIRDRGDEQRVTVRAGAGIVADSDPASEYEETERKMGGLLAALDRIEGEPAR